MTVLMALTVPAIWLMAYATQYWHFLVIGLFVGLAGGSFSVGTPYVARWFPKNRQGFAMGVYGAGNSGAAVNKFIAPALVVAFGWTMVPQAYAAIMLGDRHPVLVLQPQRPGPPGTAQHEVQRPAAHAQGPEGAQVLPVLLHRVRRLCGAVAVDGAVLHR
jgi:MFS family permease